MLDFARRPPTGAVALPAPGWAGITTSPLCAGEAATAPHRLAHHLLLLATSGAGVAEVDFVEQPCRPGTLLWSRPGQAMRLVGRPGLYATAVAWHRDLRLPDDGGSAPLHVWGPGRWQLADGDAEVMTAHLRQLTLDCRRHASGDVAAALLRHQLSVLLLRLALLGTCDPDTESTFARFRSRLERDHRQSRRVEDYAVQLGCSVRTLTRASLAVTGRTAKQLVDDRVALEAKRLLACTSLPVSEVGRRLGFPEPTNFGRFFHREAGCSPGAFRATVARPAPTRVPAPRRSHDGP